MKKTSKVRMILLAVAGCGIVAFLGWQPRGLLVLANAPAAMGSEKYASASAAHSGAEDDSARSAKSAAAFVQVWRVFTSPRCQNCHPAGDAPLQGDDSHVHAQDVKRGADGHGVTAMRCNTCHQDKNLPGANMPPGNPKWGLPPANNKMVFVGRTPGELCRQLKDPRQTGGRNLAQLLEHVAGDELVGWGWSPGEGRTLPPLNRADTVAAMRTWIDTGASCPQE
jgi:cytochrome c5